MKTLILLLVLSVTACSKHGHYDKGGKGGGNPTGTGAGVDVPNTDEPVSNEEYKETVTMEADITYSAKVKVGNNDSTLNIRNQAFKIPQKLTVSQGWAGYNTTAKVTISAVGMNSIVCTYRSQATVSHNNPSNSQQEYENGLVYAFSNCTDSSVDPTVMVDGFDKIVLNVVKADDLETKTVVSGDVKIYE